MWNYAKSNGRFDYLERHLAQKHALVTQWWLHTKSLVLIRMQVMNLISLHMSHVTDLIFVDQCQECAWMYVLVCLHVYACKHKLSLILIFLIRLSVKDNFYFFAWHISLTLRTILSWEIRLSSPSFKNVDVTIEKHKDVKEDMNCVIRFTGSLWGCVFLFCHVCDR